MLIVSRFHDFYDTAMKYGVDKTVVFERGGEMSKDKSLSTLLPYREETGWIKQGRNSYKFTFYKLIIGFCGKLYPLMYVKKECQNLIPGITPWTDEFFSFYDKEEFLSFLIENKINHKDEGRYRIWQRRTLYIDSVTDITIFFDASYWKDLLPLFRKLNAPTFIVGKEYVPSKEVEAPYNAHYDAIITKNPQLKKYKFMKVKDPVTAFQDIFMYISGVLGVPTRPMVKLSDKELAKKRGHGDPYSFRKMPTKKKRKKK